MPMKTHEETGIDYIMIAIVVLYTIAPYVKMWLRKLASL
jgi:hypothetical protein